MKKGLLFLILIYCFPSFAKNYSVAERIADIKPRVEKRIPDTLKKLSQPGAKMSLVTYKAEEVLEVWQTAPTVELLESYKMTKNSGKLGPKNKQGDRQIPEGVYRTTLLNPNSRFYLSIRINYPNEIDKQRAQFSGIKDPGSDIYIHGKDKTVGCVPIGDTAIEDVFYLVHLVGLKNTKSVISPTKLPLPNLDFFLEPGSRGPMTLEKYRRVEDEIKSLLKHSAS